MRIEDILVVILHVTGKVFSYIVKKIESRTSVLWKLFKEKACFQFFFKPKDRIASLCLKAPRKGDLYSTLGSAFISLGQV